MCSQWVNKYEILRDLSHAQGCVPVEIAGTVAAADQPPSPKITEENEEVFYQDYIGDGDSVAPDLTLIKHMLMVVHEFEKTDNDDTEQVIQISNINTLHLKCKQPEKSGAISTSSVPKKTKPKSRNVAIASLLQKQKEEILQNDSKQLKLLKPEDFTAIKNETEAIEKVNGWFETQRKETVANKKVTNTLVMDPLSMFKKRVASPNSPQEKGKVSVKTPQSCRNYVPSSEAAEYYKELQKKSKMKEILEKNVWEETERQMRDIDERRKQFSIYLSMTKPLVASSEPTTCNDFDDQKFEAVRLSQHRHILTDQCIVCAMKIKSEQAKPKSLDVNICTVVNPSQTPQTDSEDITI